MQQELPGHMALTVSYIGARGDHLPLGGTADTALNVNQLDPKYMALGSQLTTRSRIRSSATPPPARCRPRRR